MNKILAVSGGIDSMVLMHIYRNDPNAIIAHFDHGIRECSNLDAEFVCRMARAYGRPFFAERAHLGPNASEELARNERYKFLKRLCAEHDAKLYTAHHADDLAESVIINLYRGTGWRGLTPLNNPAICRPLLGWDKKQIYRYASKNSIVFRADSTNTESKYLRNRIRAMLAEHPELSKTLKDQFVGNYQIRAEIEQLESELIQDSPRAKRSIYQNLDDACASELLYYQLKLWHISITRPQLSRALDAVRHYQPGKKLSLNHSQFLAVSKHTFYLA